MTDHLIRPEYAPPSRYERAQDRGNTACVHLLLTAALILSLGVAVTVVSIGVARAGGLGTFAGKIGTFAGKTVRLR